MTWRTLTDVLASNAEAYPDKLFVRFLRRGEVVTTCTYAQTWQRASQWAALLRERGLRRNQPVVMAFPNTEDFVYAYFGTLLAGGIPAPAAPFRRLKADNHYLTNVAQRLRTIHTNFLIVPDIQASIAGVSPLNQLENLVVLTQRNVPSTSELISPSGNEHDLGLLQFTSGTSGTSKVVQLAHSALIAQMRNISIALDIHHGVDSGLSWLPVFHDMGLIGFLLTPLYRAIPLTLMQAEEFMLRPNLWIKAVSDFHASLTGGPSSAYNLCSRYLKESDVTQYDLSQLRVALVGAEMISQQALSQFAERLKPANFRTSAFLPAYGLAENGLAVTMNPLDEEPEFDIIELEAMQTLGFARRAAHHDGHSNGTMRTVASVGAPIAETEVAIVSPDDVRLSERQIGEVLVSSPSLMQGYYEQPEASSMVLRDGWLWTGDLGYVANNRLYVTGRKKEVLIVGGRNYFPDDLEQVAVSAANVRPGAAVAIAYEDQERGTEAVVMLIETPETDPAQRSVLRQRVRQALIDADYPVSEVVLLRPRTIQTTLNGKLKRVECKVRYLKREFSYDN
jgi:fatty-acyl-CoA synthase